MAGAQRCEPRMLSFLSEGNCFRPGIAPFTSGMKLLSSTTATLTHLHQLALVIREGIVIRPIRNSTESE
ncbi:hypothetical protein Y032_0016g3112 [Ancylostoma ceylanicum]|uniref:Uncharacterized protein n=1 Tax=Ancylostoma ceylanicum TaxID=53326 RepID=A0A016V8P6_9BILA|nr:hypothetical protein Y032_0016g3112 [Ancylostoma ceylanicum]